MKAGRYIEAPRSVRVKVAQELGMTESGVNHALNFVRIGGKSQEARERILQHPEAQVMAYLPECETIHDSEDLMTQTFSNGWVIKTHKTTGLVEVFTNAGELNGQYFNPCITMFSQIQDLVKAQE